MPQFPFAEAARRFTNPDDRARFALLANLHHRRLDAHDIFHTVAHRARGSVLPAH